MQDLAAIHHLLGRAAFGPSWREMPAYLSRTPQEVAESLFRDAAQYKPLQVVPPPTMTWQELKDLTPEQRKALRKKERELLGRLNAAWLEKMISGEGVLRERMTFFWHDHFACRTQNAWFAQDLNNRLRRNALGSFRTMLKEVSESAAMIQFLNNQQNKKAHPNENFAREVMELFTLGMGHYSEKDIKEAARAFTGWGFNLQGDFIFRKKLHDYGNKQFLGRSGNFGGGEILEIILEQKQTARFITQKIFRYFVNERVDEKYAEELAMDLYRSDYNIGRLMHRLFTEEPFYAEENRLRLVRSPVELLAGYGRLLPLQISSGRPLLNLQRAMGQVLFFPPNVGGWPYGTEWIDSNTLPLRMQLPGGLYAAGNSYGTQKKGQKRPLTMHVDWPAFVEKTGDIPQEQLALLVLGKQPAPEEQKLIDYATGRASGDTDRTARRLVAWMSMPEYQLV